VFCPERRVEEIVFVELLGRSCFSFLRGASHPEEMVNQAQQLGLAGLALCDTGGIYGAVRAWKAAQSHPLSFITGTELTLANQTQCANVPLPEEGSTLTLAFLVQSAKGYETLCRLLTKCHQGQEKGKSLCDGAWLNELNEGLEVLVIAPRDPRGLIWRRDDSIFEQLKQNFRGRLSLAIYRHLDGFDSIRQQWALKLASQWGVPIVASARPNSHISQRKPLSDLLYCIKNGVSLHDAGAHLRANGEAYLRSESQMLRLFRDQPGWVHQASIIAQRCQFDLKEISYHFPCELTAGQNADQRLATLTWQGVRRRFPTGIDAQLSLQIEKELRLIKKLDVAAYFLSTLHVVEIARRRKILCQGRGSAANSAVCYMLGITAVDPTRSNMLFERFLSEERAEPPDIDVDFEHERREEVIQEIYKEYGRERAAMVSEIISYRGKSAIRDVSLAFGFSLEQASRLSSTITWQSESESESESDPYETRLTDAGFDIRDARVKQIVAMAEQLRGFPRHLSIHVGGFVLSSRPLYEIAPIENARMKDRTVIPWDKDDIDALGFFKIDVLSLGMLTAIKKALQLICETGGLKGAAVGGDFDPLQAITQIPPDDESTYKMISRGDTVGVFQIESRAQMAMLPRLRPACFYDLVIEVAIVRPGPIQGGMVHPFLRRRNREEPITCPHPDLWPIVKRTLGVPLFQEQVMQIAIEGAGYSGGEADQLRRDMAAWKKNGRLMRHRKRLLNGFRKKGISEAFGTALFEQIKGFGEYGFPESHAASFALLVYASSWQKCHYPAHFTCALLNSQPMGFYPPTSLVQDAQRHGVDVRDVDLFESDWDCTLEDISSSSAPFLTRIKSNAPGAQRSLRLGLRVLKGFGDGAGKRVMQAREKAKFASLHDLKKRAQLSQAELEILAEAGALERLKKGRRNALWHAREPRSPGLFENISQQEQVVTLPVLSAAEQLVMDYGRKGLSVHDHPLAHYRAKLIKWGVTRAQDLVYLRKGTRVSVAGLVMGRQRPATASGVVFISMEDETGTCSLIVYQNVFAQYDHVARNSQLLLVHGHIERDSRLHLPTPQEQILESDEVPVIHIVVRHIERFGNTMNTLRSTSRDFH